MHAQYWILIYWVVTWKQASLDALWYHLIQSINWGKTSYLLFCVNINLFFVFSLQTSARDVRHQRPEDPEILASSRYDYNYRSTKENADTGLKRRYYDCAARDAHGCRRKFWVSNVRFYMLYERCLTMQVKDCRRWRTLLLWVTATCATDFFWRRHCA